MDMELKVLREQHEFTVIELSDLKQRYEQLNKLNNTLIESIMKDSPDTLHEIKLIIDGSFFNQRVLDLEAEIQRLRQTMDEEVERRVQQIIKSVNLGKGVRGEGVGGVEEGKGVGKEEGVGKGLGVGKGEGEGVGEGKGEQHRLKDAKKDAKDKNNNNNENIDQENVEAECSRCKILEAKLREKCEDFDKLRLENEEIKADFEILHSKKSAFSQQKFRQLEQINKILKNSLKEQENMIGREQHNRAMSDLNSQWEEKYRNLAEQLQESIDRIEELESRNHQNSGFFATPQRQQKGSKENCMLKQIQNLVGELATKKSSSNIPRFSKAATSRIISDSDYSSFSIKDAINRPNNLNFY